LSAAEKLKIMEPNILEDGAASKKHFGEKKKDVSRLTIAKRYAASFGRMDSTH
jgi:hypothetical protein